MHHIIIIKETKINVYIKRCPVCEESMAVLFGKKAKVCLDCIKDRNYPQKHLPAVILTKYYTNKRIITLIKENKIQQFNVMKKIPQQSMWTFENYMNKKT